MNINSFSVTCSCRVVFSMFKALEVIDNNNPLQHRLTKLSPKPVNEEIVTELLEKSMKNYWVKTLLTCHKRKWLNYWDLLLLQSKLETWPIKLIMNINCCRCDSLKSNSWSNCVFDMCFLGLPFSWPCDDVFLSLFIHSFNICIHVYQIYINMYRYIRFNIRAYMNRFYIWKRQMDMME